MLTLQRFEGERIIIETPSGEVITIALVEVRAKRCARVGVHAPADFLIYREEAPDRYRRPAKKTGDGE